MSDLIKFSLKNKPKKVIKCSFCNDLLIKGKYIQSDETEPAICFSCVARCDELIKDGDKNEEN